MFFVPKRFDSSRVIDSSLPNIVRNINSRIAKVFIASVLLVIFFLMARVVITKFRPESESRELVKKS